MDKDFLLDLLVSVRERNIDVNTALDEICAMENNVEAGENTLPIQHVSDSALNDAFKNGYKAAIDNLNACYKDIFD